jgi:hypothetical protein
VRRTVLDRKRGNLRDVTLFGGLPTGGGFGRMGGADDRERDGHP